MTARYVVGIDLGTTNSALTYADAGVGGDQDATGGQKLVITNDARVAHNAKVQGGPLNGTVNKLIGAWNGKDRKQEEVFALKPERDAVRVSCDVHTWMSAYVRVFDHPYAAVTNVGANLSDSNKPVWENLKDPNVGKFEIKGAPIGAKVRLAAWVAQQRAPADVRPGDALGEDAQRRIGREAMAPLAGIGDALRARMILRAQTRRLALQRLQRRRGGFEVDEPQLGHVRVSPAVAMHRHSAGSIGGAGNR